MRPGPVPTDALERDGFAVVEGALDQRTCNELSTLLDELWEIERDIERSHLDPEPGVDFIENVFRLSATFDFCVTEPLVLNAVRSVIGTDFHLSLLNSRVVNPRHGSQTLHQLSYPRGRPFERCTVIWCLDEFTSDNGATRVIPGSHLAWEGDPAGTADDDKHPHVVLTAPRGAAIVFNTKLIHAGTRNTTVTPRRSLHGQYVVAGRPTHSNWRSLPDGVRRVLSPGALALMGLESAEVIGGAP